MSARNSASAARVSSFCVSDLSGVRAPRLTPAVLGYVEDDAVGVLEFLLGIDTRIFRQLHEEFAAVFLDLLFGLSLVVDDKSKVMQSSPIRTALAALGPFRELQQRQIHHPVR